MKKIALLTAMACSILVSPLQADETDAPKWYIGAGGGISYVDPDTNNTGFSVDDDNDFGYKIFAGYDWTPRISTEVYYADLGEATIDPFGEVEYKDYGFSGLFYFLKQEQDHQGWGLFGRIGIGWMDNDSDLPFERDNDTHVLFGMGAEYGFANNLGVRLDTDFFDEDAQLFSINLMARF